MSVNAAAVYKGIVNTWSAAGLDSVFNQYWDESFRSSFPVLHDQSAGPRQPWPYCVMDAFGVSSIGVMSGGPDSVNQEYSVSLTFHIFAKRTNGKSAKELAAELAEEVQKVFGGHPSVSPRNIVLDNGEVFLCRFERDYGEAIGDDEYTWIVEYDCRIDMPVKV